MKSRGRNIKKMLVGTGLEKRCQSKPCKDGMQCTKVTKIRNAMLEFDMQLTSIQPIRQIPIKREQRCDAVNKLRRLKLVMLC